MSIYNPTREHVIEWGIGVFNRDGDLVKVVTHREAIASPRKEKHTEATARLDRQAWVGPLGGFRDEPDLIQVVSHLITPWDIS